MKCFRDVFKLMVKQWLVMVRIIAKLFISMVGYGMVLMIIIESLILISNSGYHLGQLCLSELRSFKKADKASSSRQNQFLSGLLRVLRQYKNKVYSLHT